MSSTRRGDRQTLVTCLFDLEKRERIGRRPIEFYFEHGELVLGLEQPLVAYVDPELSEWVRASRRDRGLDELTRVIERPLESLPLYPVFPVISGYRTFANDDPKKGTPLHQIIEWSKLDLIDEVMREDPFGTGHFAWIDFGVGHVAEPPVSFPAPARRVAVLQMCAIARHEVDDATAFLGYERGRIAAGFFRGSREYLVPLVAAFRDVLDATIAQQFRANEQMLLGYLTVQRPELFEFYYGDYASILCNWDYVRRDVETVFLNLSHCRATSLWNRAFSICTRTSASHAAGVLALTDDQRTRLLDEFYLAAWYVGRRDIAAAVRHECLTELADSAYFKEHNDRLLKNFDFVSRIDPALLEAAGHAATTTPPLVSVVIPVHNGQATLARAVDSVLNQSVGHLEVIIVDDGSSDGSLALARSMAAADSRVRVVSRPRASGGPATPRDEGVAASSGRFVALLDQDDYWLPGKLAAQLPLFDAPDVAVVYSDAYFVPDAGSHGHLDDYATSSLTMTGFRLPEGDIAADLRREDCVPALTAVIRREWLSRVGRFDRHQLVGVDDYYYWLRISLSGGRFAAVQQPLAVHCRRPESLGTVRHQECAESLTRMWAALATEYPSV